MKETSWALACTKRLMKVAQSKNPRKRRRKRLASVVEARGSESNQKRSQVEKRTNTMATIPNSTRMRILWRKAKKAKSPRKRPEAK
jgi:hypothetical protein